MTRRISSFHLSGLSENIRFQNSLPVIDDDPVEDNKICTSQTNEPSGANTRLNKRASVCGKHWSSLKSRIHIALGQALYATHEDDIEDEDDNKEDGKRPSSVSFKDDAQDGSNGYTCSAKKNCTEGLASRTDGTDARLALLINTYVGGTRGPVDVYGDKSRMATLRNARAIQTLVQEVGDDANRCHERWQNRRDLQDRELSKRCSDTRSLAVRAEHDVRKVAARLRVSRRSNIERRISDDSVGASSARDSCWNLGVPRTMPEACSSSKNGESIMDIAKPTLLTSIPREAVKFEEPGLPAREDGSGLKCNLAPPLASSVKFQLRHQRDSIILQRDSVSFGTSPEERQAEGEGSPNHCLSKRRCTAAVGLRVNLPGSAIARRKRRCAEVPRLRNRFRDQRKILSGRFVAEASTVKRTIFQSAERLGLDVNDWDPDKVYETSIIDLRNAVRRKDLQVRYSSATLIQRQWRRVSAVCAYSSLLGRTLRAASKIQRWWRRMLKWRLPIFHQVQRRPILANAAVRIQSSFLGHIARRRLASEQQVHSVVWRMARLREALGHSEEQAALLLQAAARGWLVRRRCRRLRTAAPQDSPLAVEDSSARQSAGRLYGRRPSRWCMQLSARGRRPSEMIASRVRFPSTSRKKLSQISNHDDVSFAAGGMPWDGESCIVPTLFERCAMAPVSSRCRATIATHDARMHGLRASTSHCAVKSVDMSLAPLPRRSLTQPMFRNHRVSNPRHSLRGDLRSSLIRRPLATACERTTTSDSDSCAALTDVSNDCISE